MCSRCEKSFRTKPLLSAHVRAIHLDERPFKCKKCNKKFRRRAVLILHERIHTGEKPFTCDVCERPFNSKVHLKRHMKIHTGDRPHKCSHCDKTFIQAYNLTAEETPNSITQIIELCYLRFPNFHKSPVTSLGSRSFTAYLPSCQ